MHSDFPYGDPRLSHSLERDHLAPALLRRVRRLRFRFGRGRFHEAADLLCRASLHIVGDVRIGVERKPCAIVAQHAGQGLHIYAAGEGHRCESVAKVVEPHMLTTCVFQDELQPAAHHAGGDGAVLLYWRWEHPA